MEPIKPEIEISICLGGYLVRCMGWEHLDGPLAGHTYICTSVAEVERRVRDYIEAYDRDEAKKIHQELQQR